jgi:hypothetical protein
MYFVDNTKHGFVEPIDGIELRTSDPFSNTVRATFPSKVSEQYKNA